MRLSISGLLMILALFVVYSGNLFYNSKSGQSPDLNDKCANDIFEMPRSKSDVPKHKKQDSYYVVTREERKKCYDAKKDVILIPSITFENGKGDKRTFNFPKDCADYKKFNQVVAGNYWADQATSNDISGLSYQCDKYDLMEQEKKDQSKIGSDHDFVSKYDFMNMSLDDISYQILCSGVMSKDGEEACSKIEKDEKKMGKGDYYSYLDVSLNGDVKQTRLLPRDKNCRLKDGKFQGVIDTVNAIVKCNKSEGDDAESDKGVVVYSVRFADVNKDGFLDAILIVGAINSGSAGDMATHYETYTKTSATQKRFTYLK